MVGRTFPGSVPRQAWSRRLSVSSTKPVTFAPGLMATRAVYQSSASGSGYFIDFLSRRLRARSRRFGTLRITPATDCAALSRNDRLYATELCDLWGSHLPMGTPTGSPCLLKVSKERAMPINDPNLQHETPGGRKPKFGGATMLLLACGAVFVAGLFIFFVVYGAANSVAH
jgi:hypothetical protein